MKLKIIIIFILLFIGMCVHAQGESVDIGYPVVDEMETRVFGGASPQQDIYQRLDRLESRVFGHQNNSSLSERVDALKDALLGNNSRDYSNDNDEEEDYRSRMNYTNAPQTMQEYSVILYQLEKKLLGNVYISEPAETRLARLENRIFYTSSDNYPIDERIQRLCAYADAMDSNNDFNDLAQSQKYTNVSNGVRALSILFMILQFFL